jgi:hypothetical protein
MKRKDLLAQRMPYGQKLSLCVINMRTTHYALNNYPLRKLPFNFAITKLNPFSFSVAAFCVSALSRGNGSPGYSPAVQKISTGSPPRSPQGAKRAVFDGQKQDKIKAAIISSHKI